MVRYGGRPNVPTSSGVLARVPSGGACHFLIIDNEAGDEETQSYVVAVATVPLRKQPLTTTTLPFQKVYFCMINVFLVLFQPLEPKPFIVTKAPTSKHYIHP